MVLGGMLVVVVAIVVGVIAVGMRPARPAMILGFAGLVVVAGAAVMIGRDTAGLFGALLMAAGLLIGAGAVVRDARETPAKGPRDVLSTSD